MHESISPQYALIRISISTGSSTLPDAYSQPKKQPLTQEDLLNPRYCASCVQRVQNEKVNTLTNFLHTLNQTDNG